MKNKNLFNKIKLKKIQDPEEKKTQFTFTINDNFEKIYKEKIVKVDNYEKLHKSTNCIIINNFILNEGIFYEIIKDENNKIKEYLCKFDDNCEKKFKLKASLTLHYSNIHMNLKRFKCFACEKTYFKKSSNKLLFLQSKLKRFLNLNL